MVEVTFAEEQSDPRARQWTDEPVTGACGLQAAKGKLSPQRLCVLTLWGPQDPGYPHTGLALETQVAGGGPELFRCDTERQVLHIIREFQG